MSKIKVMSENLANKIAAGEVIEKCSSVVKELVENSIDAESSEIIIELEDGGLKSIAVKDNGVGMDLEDAKTAFLRHATSKITRDDDLFFIGTLGFRGEALPSIASVSEVVLKTSTGDVGTTIHIKGGKTISEEKSDALKGTSITITNLFYNTPARLKYLKSEQSELASCVMLIEREALSHPEIAFSLSNNCRVLVKTSGSKNLLKTIHEVYGLNISSKMIEIKASNDDFDIYGYVCKPEILKSNRNHMITMVNDRVIRNNEINRSINDAYYTYKPDIKYPVVVLKIDTDPTLIDVNIHPTKQDIKISKIEVLNDLIFNTIKKALYDNLLIPDATLRLSEDYNDFKKEIIDSKIEEQNEKYESEEFVQTTFNLSDLEESNNEDVIINEEMKQLKLYPVGQAHGTYIIAENEDGVFLIDQHAAQERVNYEKIQEKMKDKKVMVTDMLIPITIELSQSEFLSLKDNFEYLEDLGFKVEEFGINTVVFKSHPTWLIEGYEEVAIRNIVDLIIDDKKKFDLDTFNENMIKSMACKMSIRANTPMSFEAMEELLNNLVKCKNPYNCCHGRPSIIKFSNYELERMFKRVMN